MNKVKHGVKNSTCAKSINTHEYDATRFSMTHHSQVIIMPELQFIDKS